MLVAINERGMRVGEDHQRAKFTNHEIDLIRDLHDDGMPISEIARKFEVSKSYVHDVVHCIVRAQTPVKFKEVEVLVFECSVEGDE